MKFDEAFKNYPQKVRQYHKRFPKMLIGRKIVDLEYGPDADGDPELYYFVLDNGIKIGIARVYLKPDSEGNAKVEEENRQKYYTDKSGKYILRFQFLNWPTIKKEAK